MADKVTSIEDAIRAAQGVAAKPPAVERNTAPATKLLVPVTEFLAEMTPPVWVLQGVMQQGQVHALTAITNHGKTAIGLLLAVCIATGTRFAGREIMPGAVLILCGEDPIGFRTRLRATMAALKVEIEDVAGRIIVLPHSLPLRSHLDQIKDEARAAGVDYSLVMIDTSVTYFTGEDENDNLAMRDHALDMRELTELPGRPAVLANCHPVGNATRDSLRPRGGSAFQNEIDCNLTVWAESETATLHWQGKKRGPDFDPIPFEFHGTTLNEGGIPVPTVVAWPISDERALKLKHERRENENKVLFAILHHPNDSIAAWCSACGWDSTKNKSKVHRILGKLKEDGLVKVYRNEWTLTPAGKTEAQGIQ